jgi:hypothetical protein
LKGGFFCPLGLDSLLAFLLLLLSLIIASFCGTIQDEGTDSDGDRNDKNLYPIKEPLLRKSGPPPSEVVAKVDKDSYG